MPRPADKAERPRGWANQTMVERFLSGEEGIAYVFISHINEDKPRLRFLVRELLVRGVNVWIDNPDRLNLAFDSIGPWFGRLGRIAAGRKGEDEIETALKRCNAVLIALTSSAAQAYSDQPRRRVFRGEVDYALGKGIGVPVELEALRGLARQAIRGI